MGRFGRDVPGGFSGAVTVASGIVLGAGGIVGLLVGSNDGPTIVSILAGAGLVALSAVRFGGGDHDRTGGIELSELLARVDERAAPVIGDLSDPWPALVRDVSSGVAVRRLAALQRTGTPGPAAASDGSDGSDGRGPDLGAVAAAAVADARATIETTLDEVAGSPHGSTDTADSTDTAPAEQAEARPDLGPPPIAQSARGSPSSEPELRGESSDPDESAAVEASEVAGSPLSSTGPGSGSGSSSDDTTTPDARRAAAVTPSPGTSRPENDPS